MKKTLLTLAAAGCFTALSAQTTIPNGDFETWSQVTYDEPTGYITSIWEALDMGLPVNTTQTTDAQQNTYAVRMETITNGTDTLFGYITNGDPGTGEGGIPLGQVPSGLTGYWKGDIMPGDTALVIVMCKLGGSLVSFDILPVTGMAASYTPFTLPIVLPPLTVPDSVIIAVASSNAFVSMGLPGSWIQIDNISFTGILTQPAQLNGDFENWTTTSYTVPQAWTLGGDSILQSSDMHNGNYAVHLETYSYGTGTSPSFITNAQFTQSGIDHGRPYTMQTDTLCGWYKFAGVSDSAFIYAEFTNMGTVIGGYYLELEPAAVYTYFEIPIALITAPDSMMVLAGSSTGMTGLGDVGSTLLLDDLQLKSQAIPTGIRPNWSDALSLQAWPNPSNGQFSISFTNASGEDAQLTIIDALGRSVHHETLNGTGKLTQQIDLSSEEKGMYFVRVTQSGKTFTKKVLVN